MYDHTHYLFAFDAHGRHTSIIVCFSTLPSGVTIIDNIFHSLFSPHLYFNVIYQLTLLVCVITSSLVV